MRCLVEPAHCRKECKWKKSAALLVALGLGAAIGLERKLNDHSAGVHTGALVALGSSLFVLTGIKLAAPGEMARVASQVVMGIGFLGAAVIMRDGLQVRGMTAVTIWCSWAIGAIAGAGSLYACMRGHGCYCASRILSCMCLNIAQDFFPSFRLPGKRKTDTNLRLKRAKGEVNSLSHRERVPSAYEAGEGLRCLIVESP